MERKHSKWGNVIVKGHRDRPSFRAVDDGTSSDCACDSVFQFTVTAMQPNKNKTWSQFQRH